jgi:tetratricopeptide (TPR) repeat protein
MEYEDRYHITPIDDRIYYTNGSPRTTSTFYPVYGIPLTYLDEFVLRAGGRDVFLNKTTAMVCNEIIVPWTQGSRCSYCDLLRAMQAPLMNEANYYIVHSWEMRFLDLYDSIKDYFDKRDLECLNEEENLTRDEIVLWIDVFSFNYHLNPLSNSNAGMVFDQLKALIEYIQYTIVIVPSWKDPLPLIKTWSLLEIFFSIQKDCVLEFFMMERVMKSFLNDLKHGKCDSGSNGEYLVSPLSYFLSGLNFLKSEPRNYTEKEMILKYFQGKNLSNDYVNNCILSRTREFIKIIVENLLKVSAMTSFATSSEVIITEEERMNSKMILASLYVHENNYTRAEYLYLECLSEREDGYNSENSTASLENNFSVIRCKYKLAQLYWKIGEYDKGESLARDCYAKRLMLLGGEHPETLSSMKTLALILGEQNKLEESIELHMLCMNKRKKKLGEDHPSTIQSMKNLAMVLAKNCKFDESIKLYSICLEKAKRIFGLDHAHTISSMGQLASLYHSQGQYFESELLYNELLDLSRQVYGENDLETIKVLTKLTNLLAEQKNYSKIELFLECFDKKKLIYSINHLETLKSMNNLANAYYISGKYNKGEKLYRECLEISKEILGISHQDTVGAMYNLANLYYKQRKFQEAEEMYEKSFLIRREHLGDSHLQTLASMSSLAYIYYKQHKYKKSEDLYEQLLEKQIEVMGESHLKTLRTMVELASVYIERNKLDLAEDLLMKCFKKKRVLLGDDHPETLTLMDDLGYLYYTNNKFKEAEMLLNQCLLRRTMKLGEEHADTLSSMNHLALLFKDLKKYPEAEELYSRCLTKKKQLFGETHSSTIETTMNLASIYYARGKYSEAEDLYLHCLEKNKKLIKNEESSFHKMILGNLKKVRDMIEKTSGGASATSRGLLSKDSTLASSSSTIGDQHNSAFFPSNGRSHSSSPASSLSAGGGSNSHSPTGRISASSTTSSCFQPKTIGGNSPKQFSPKQFRPTASPGTTRIMSSHSNSTTPGINEATTEIYK